MKKFLVVVIMAAMCSSIFSFTAHSLETTAQAIVQRNSIFAATKTVKPVVDSVDLEGKDIEGLKEKDITDYYKSNSDAISKLLSTEKADVPPGGTTWAKAYDGNHAILLSIQQTSDGGYIGAGRYLDFFAPSDILVIKLDPNGAVSWAKTYRGSDVWVHYLIWQTDDLAKFIQQTSDGGYIVAGRTCLIYGDFLVIKLDPNGAVTWAKTYGGSSEDWAYSIQQTSDGGYIVAGRTFSFGAGQADFLIIKLDPNGAVTWAKTYGGSDYDEVYSFQQTSDGGYVVEGMTLSFGLHVADFLVIKLDPNGAVTWAKTYGGNRGEVAHSIQQTSDGGYIIAGFTNSFGAGQDDFLIIKLDSNGAVTWAKTYGGSEGDGAWPIQQTLDGGYIVAGYTFSFGTGDALVIKVDSSGEIGGSCDYLKDVTGDLVVNSVNPTVSDQTPAVKEPTFSVSSPNLIITSPNFSASTICESVVYTITASAGPGGTITPSGSISVNYGDSKAFTIKADPGFMIFKVLVDNSPIAISNPFIMTYTFSNVTSNHTIRAEFMPVPDTTPPVITRISGIVIEDLPDFKTNKDTYTFTVEAYDESGIARMVVKVNSVVQIDKNLNGIIHLDRNNLNFNPITIYLKEGVNIVEVIVYDTKGNFTSKTFKVIKDSTPPTITLSEDVPEYTSHPTLTLKGVVYDNISGVKSFTINGVEVPVTLEGNFEYTLNLQQGANTITLEATDRLGNTSKKTFTITFAQSATTSKNYIITLKVNDPNITINGISKPIDEQGSKPIIINGRTLLPIRVIIESLGGSIEWNAKEQKVTITLNGHSIILWIGKKTALVDGEKVTLDVAPQVIKGRTYIPLRFVVENLGASVDWDKETKTLTIYYYP